MSVAELPTDVIVRPEEVAKCWDCYQPKPLSEMATKTTCKQCEYARDNRRSKLTKQRAAGRAIRKLAVKIGQDPAVIQKPHEIYADIMEGLGGAKRFAKMVVEDYLDCRTADPKPRKVLLDYTKAFFALGLEAQKTAPTAKSTSLMSDEELTEEAARMANEELKLLLDEQEERIEHDVAEVTE